MVIGIAFTLQTHNFVAMIVDASSRIQIKNLGYFLPYLFYFFDSIDDMLKKLLDHFIIVRIISKAE